MEGRTVEREATGVTRILFLTLGLLLTGLGILGAFVPLMPTTIFLILAVACFARSSRRLELWLLGHARLGPPIRRWRDHGAISPLAKTLAVGSMAVGLFAFWFTAQPNAVVFTAALLAIAACAGFVLSRPSGPPSPSGL